MKVFEPIGPKVPTGGPADEEINRVREVLESLTAVSGLDLLVAGNIKLAHIQLGHTSSARWIGTAPGPSTDVRSDLVRAFDLLTTEALIAPTAATCIQFATAARYLQDALNGLDSPREPGTTGPK